MAVSLYDDVILPVACSRRYLIIQDCAAQCWFCIVILIPQEDRFYQRYPCIVITAKGQPDVASRMFLSRITSELQIPVLALVDSDPYGLKILSVYMSGSKNMSYDSASLTTPDIKWLGLRPSDLNKWALLCIDYYIIEFRTVITMLQC
jgi:hypothetical protein